MENFEIDNIGDQMILKLNKKGFDKNYLIALVKRLQMESLAQKSRFDAEILNIAEEINQDWWNENREAFLNPTCSVSTKIAEKTGKNAVFSK